MSFGLPEEIVLLGLDDSTGKCISSYAQYSWNAAAIAELALRGRLDLSGATVQVRDSSPVGDEVLDAVLRSLRERPRKLASAIRASLIPHGRDLTLQRLVQAGILEYHDNRVLGLFHFRRYPAHDGLAEGEIRGRLRAAALEQTEPDVRTRTLLSLAAGVGLLRSFLSREEREAARGRIDQLTSGEIVGETLRRVIEEDEAAATTATIIAATT